MLQRVLDVPYFVQPTPITCQSTCLKMFSTYLEQKGQFSSSSGGKSIQEIWKEINTGSERPVKARNAYANMKWWLEKYFAPQKFDVFQTIDVPQTMGLVKARIDAGFPVMVSTNHDRTAGHIIMVVGYRTLEGPVSGDMEFICHDPYGKFDPQLASVQYGGRRYESGSSLASGGEHGPGRAVVYDYEGIRRVREDKHSAGKFFLISGKA